MKNYVLTSVLVGSVLVLSACKPVDWAEQKWNSAFNQSKDEKVEEKNDHKQHHAEQNDQNEEKPTQTDEEKEQTQQKDLPWLNDTVTVSGDGKAVVQNLNDMLIVANKERNLPADYEPVDLVIPNVPFPFKEDLPKKKLRKEAAASIELLFKGAEEQGLQLLAQSGYRSYDTQVSIFAYNAQQYGEEKANQTSAQPGQSEHQTGLSLDVTSPEVNYDLVEKFGETKEGKWLAENAYQYGFIIRYPKGKEDVTGYKYEPWHLRYVGKEHAKEIHDRGVTLEEYLKKP
ncbi:M15 family metallopeptidase [Fictibacillus phosphorivorans]|uniref:M15 family metallopeptidase n=1 Tax=Fictibacillus phosphorivorans TaxID=1221500 RepID=UPI0020411182|nr:M15 family metallopeptidase [Fictibacillus phosphorivorans]MCM3717049.1 M15 family metallopeptidase [Fictibacillus phosphorivorans]MCM3774736.1 M15 family metallopeptidase [Fictibacillus phosphorivorans]